MTFVACCTTPDRINCGSVSMYHAQVPACSPRHRWRSGESAVARCVSILNFLWHINKTGYHDLQNILRLRIHKINR